MNAFDRIAKARSALVMSQPFFGSLALRLEVRERPEVGTMATDGRSLFFAPEWVAGLTDPELMGVLAHEVMHCALRHFARQGIRADDAWNVACDHAINLDLRAAGFVLPAGGLWDSRFRGMSAEQIHSALFPPVPPPPAPNAGDAGDDGEYGDDDGAGGGSDAGDDDGEEGDGAGAGDGAGDDGETGDAGDGAGDGETDDGAGDTGDGAGSAPAGGKRGTGRAAPSFADPGACGGVIRPEPETADGETDAADLAALESEWEVYTRQAVNAAIKHAGSVPGFLAAVVDSLNAPKVSWRDVLRRFVDESASRDYSWMRPNRRHVAAGVILPGLVSDSLSRLVIAVDTSGSIYAMRAALESFLSEIQGAMDDGAADRITVLQADTAVRHVEEYERGDVIPSRPRIHGGGGTDFRDTFARIAADYPDAAAVVYFTDMMVTEWGTDPGIPTLWAAYGSPAALRHRRPPFGESIHIDPSA